MVIKKYPDGASYASLDGGVAPAQFTHRINSYEDLWHLNQKVELCNYHGFEPVVTIPNLLDAQADRRFSHDQSSGLKLVCQFLNNMKATFNIFHPHNQEVVEALIDDVSIMSNEYLVKNVLSRIGVSAPKDGLRLDGDCYNVPNLVLMSADAGGFKPLMKTVKEINWSGGIETACKSRSKDGVMEQVVAREDFKGQDVLIIDDMCVGGGTFIGLAKMLKERNVGNLYLLVSHMTVQYLKNPELFDLFEHIYTSNSKFDKYWIPDSDGHKSPKNLSVISLFNKTKDNER